MNAVCFIAVFSAANSTIYASARSLMALANEGHAPRFLGRTYHGVPIPAVAVSVFFGCLAFAGKFIGDGVVFNWLVAISGLGTIVAWFMICLVHIRFRHAYVAQGYKVRFKRELTM
jgi:lysine-specific permease